MYVATLRTCRMEMCVWKCKFAFDQTLCRVIDAFHSQMKL